MVIVVAGRGPSPFGEGGLQLLDHLHGPGIHTAQDGEVDRDQIAEHYGIEVEMVRDVAVDRVMTVEEPGK